MFCFFSALWFKKYRLNFWLDKRPVREERYQKEISNAHYRSFSNRLPAMIYWWCYFKYCLWQKHKYICKSGLARTRNGKREVFHWHQYMLNLSISQSCLINKTQSPLLFGGSRPSFRVDLKNKKSIPNFSVKSISRKKNSWKWFHVKSRDFTHFEFGIQKTKTIWALFFTFLLTMRRSDMRMVPYTSVRKV